MEESSTEKEAPEELSRMRKIYQESDAISSLIILSLVDNNKYSNQLLMKTFGCLKYKIDQAQKFSSLNTGIKLPQTDPKTRAHTEIGKAIYNWKFIHHHLPHLDFCWQHCHILFGHNTRIRNFWYLVFYIFCFSFCLLLYLDGTFTVEKYKLLLPWLVKNNITKLTHICVMNSYGLFIFKSNVQKNIWRKFWNSKYRCVSLCTFLRDIAIL